MADAAPTPALERYGAYLREHLAEKRLLHCISVANTARGIAEATGLDADRMETAGLLHDAARMMNGDALLHRALGYALPVDEFTQAHPLLLHGPVAAEMVTRELGIDDDDIYEAIYWHTTGHPGIGLMAQALIVADFSEPLRKYVEAGEVRDILRTQGFDAALHRTANAKLAFARKKDQYHPETALFRDWVEAGKPGERTAP